jgi:hypothetical protein
MHSAVLACSRSARLMASLVRLLGLPRRAGSVKHQARLAGCSWPIIFLLAVMLDFDPEFTVRFQTLATMLAVIE